MRVDWKLLAIAVIAAAFLRCGVGVHPAEAQGCKPSPRPPANVYIPPQPEGVGDLELRWSWIEVEDQRFRGARPVIAGRCYYAAGVGDVHSTLVLHNLANGKETAVVLWAGAREEFPCAGKRDKQRAD